MSNPVWQLVLNVTLLADKAANTALLGSPNETLSTRTARANVAGKRWAVLACRVAGRINADHCAKSIGGPSLGREIWAWSPVAAIKAAAKVPVA